MKSITQVPNSAETQIGRLERDAPHDPVHFVALIEQQFSQVAAVLARYSSDQCNFHFGRTVGRVDAVAESLIATCRHDF